ncbi:hypothetical protein ECHHL_0638 [Ehrlichia chaffeensis str. Heartland]|nr:hypothetical protein ECHHL_0638 [Ehrlichia chaffeensis str. Heartland]AHX10680.1 hypothetical protein ECHWP_0633 [Ehrlichia chaffeensis str. West Paces]
MMNFQRSKAFTALNIIGLMFIYCASVVLLYMYITRKVSINQFIALLSCCLICSIFLLKSVYKRLLTRKDENTPVPVEPEPIILNRYVPEYSTTILPEHYAANYSIHRNLCSISQNLKLLISQPYGISEMESYPCRNHYLNVVHGSRDVLLFPKFRGYFDYILDKLICAGMFVEHNPVDIRKVKDLLGEENFTFVILAAQLIIRNEALYATYSESAYDKIAMLYNLSIEEVPYQERLNSANKIIRLLGNKVYSFSSQDELCKFLSNVFREYMHDCVSEIGNENDFYRMVNNDQKFKLLQEIFCMSYFKYYCIYGHRSHAVVTQEIDLASNIIGQYDEPKAVDDETIIERICNMRKSGFEVELIDNCCSVLNVQEIISQIFEQTVIENNRRVSSFETDKVTRLLGTIEDVIEKVKEVTHYDAVDVVSSGRDYYRLMINMAYSGPPYNRMFISKELSMIMNQEECLFSVFSSFYDYARIVDKVTWSLADFEECEAEAANRFKDAEYYILYTRLKAKLDVGLFILHTRPDLPMTQDQILKVWYNDDASQFGLDKHILKDVLRNIVCCARVVCCLPYLLHSYPENIVDYIRMLARLDIDIYCTANMIISYDSYDICVFKDQDEFQQMINSFLISYNEYYKDLDTGLDNSRVTFGSSFDIVLVSLMYTSLYNSSLVEQHVIDAACNRMKSFNFCYLERNYRSLMTIIAETVNCRHNSIYWPLCEMDLSNSIDMSQESNDESIGEKWYQHTILPVLGNSAMTRGSH